MDGRHGRYKVVVGERVWLLNDVGTDPGYTVYSQRHESGKYPDDCVFGTAPVEGRNPFNRNGGYSNPIDDPTKREEYVV